MKLVAYSALLYVIASASPALAQAVPRTPARVVYPAPAVVVRRPVVVAPVRPAYVYRPVVTPVIAPVVVAGPAYVYRPVVRVVPPPPPPAAFVMGPRVGVFFAIR